MDEDHKQLIKQIALDIWKGGLDSVLDKNTHGDILVALINIMIHSVKHVKDPQKYELLKHICIQTINQAKEKYKDDVDGSDQSNTKG